MTLNKTSIILALIFLFATASNAEADWVDDWINQRVVTGPDSFETQKRNYATAGSVSARWSTTADPLIAISKPRFSAGCGGIDAYLGGFSFMEYDYLVQKLQRIMGPAAAAFAFDIALNTLCEPCANGIKAFEAIVDRLNQLQLDDCKASKVVATTVLSGLSDNDRLSSMHTQAWTDFVQSSGASDLWQSIKESAGDGTADDVGAAGGGVTSDSLVSSCPALMKQAFFTDGSLLGNLSGMRGYPDAYVDLMRGLIGDITITDTVDHVFIPPCANNHSMTGVAEQIYTGEIEGMDESGTCAELSSTGITVSSGHYSSYRDWVISTLTGIASKMMTGASFTPDEMNMLENTPGNVYSALKGYLLNMGENASPSEAALHFERLVGKHYVYTMFRDFYKYFSDIINYAASIPARQRGTASGGDQKSCQLKFLTATLESLDEMKKKTGEMMQMAYSAYMGETKRIWAEQEMNQGFSDSQKRGAARIQDMISQSY